MAETFDRKVLRKTYGPGLANGQWRNKYKNEIYHLYKENVANQEHLIEKIPAGGSRVETERRKGA